MEKISLNYKFVLVFILFIVSNLLSKSWTFYIHSTNVVSGDPGYFEATIGIKANSAADQEGLGNSAVRGTMSSDLYDFESGYNPEISEFHLVGDYEKTLTDGGNPYDWRLNIFLNSGSGEEVIQGGIRVATIRFFISNPSGTSDLSLGFLQQTYEDDNITSVSISYDNSNGDQSLPVELSLFNAEVNVNKIILVWRTESETNNLGFEIYRSLIELDNYMLISSYEFNSDLRGQGNSANQKNYSYADTQVLPGITYWYKLADVDFNGKRSYFGPISARLNEPAKTFNLYPAYPNPFNSSTTIRFDIPQGSEELQLRTKLLIYDNLGSVVKTLMNKDLFPQSYEVEWDGSTDNRQSVPSGIYYLRFSAGDFQKTMKIVLLK